MTTGLICRHMAPDELSHVQLAWSDGYLHHFHLPEALVSIPHAQGPRIPQSFIGHLFENVLLVQKTWNWKKPGRKKLESICHRKVHLLATPRFGPVHVIVACKACLSAIVLPTNHLEIYTKRAKFPASCTLALAKQPRHRLDDTSCKNQAESYRHHFHFTVVL